LNCFLEVKNVFLLQKETMLHQSFIEVIKRYAPFTEDELAEADPYFRIVKVKKNEFFNRAGVINKEVGFVLEGLLRCYHVINEKEITTEFLAPGAIALDMMNYVKKMPHTENIVALKDTLLNVITQEDLDLLYKKNWKWQHLGREMAERNYLRVENRAFCLQILNARDRFEHFKEHEGELLHEVPLQYIASYLGIAPETFSRIRSKKN